MLCVITNSQLAIFLEPKQTLPVDDNVINTSESVQTLFFNESAGRAQKSWSGDETKLTAAVVLTKYPIRGDITAMHSGAVPTTNPET